MKSLPSRRRVCPGCGGSRRGASQPQWPLIARPGRREERACARTRPRWPATTTVITYDGRRRAGHGLIKICTRLGHAVAAARRVHRTTGCRRKTAGQLGCGASKNCTPRFDGGPSHGFWPPVRAPRVLYTPGVGATVAGVVIGRVDRLPGLGAAGLERCEQASYMEREWMNRCRARGQRPLVDVNGGLRAICMAAGC